MPNRALLPVGTSPLPMIVSPFTHFIGSALRLLDGRFTWGRGWTLEKRSLRDGLGQSTPKVENRTTFQLSPGLNPKNKSDLASQLARRLAAGVKIGVWKQPFREINEKPIYQTNNSHMKPFTTTSWLIGWRMTERNRALAIELAWREADKS